MDANSHSDTYSVSSLSITNETKDKFDALLKAAVRRKKILKKVSKSKEKLLEDCDSATTASSENLLEKDIETSKELPIPLVDYSNKRSYILNKFLGQTSNDSCDVVEEKPPVPIPRKHKPMRIDKTISPTISQATFEVVSPKIVQNNNDSTTSSNMTYNIEEIGDVVIHHDKSSEKPKAAVRTQMKRIKSSDDDIKEISDETNGLSSVREKQFICKSLRERKKHDDDKLDEIIELDGLSKNNDSVIYSNKVQTGKNKNIKRKKDKIGSGMKTEDRTDEEDKESLIRTYNYEKIIEIIVHKTDRLELNSLVVHPVVQIHIVDIGSGKYFLKSDKSRSVVFFYENYDIDYISPVMTHAYNLQEKRSLEPSWEETILINEDFNYLSEESNRLILFFEILDFVSFSMVQSTPKKCNNGWHKIAFAFLKLSSTNGSYLNIGKKVRLQLYHPGSVKSSNDVKVCNPWKWWRKQKLLKYPSTLHITIKPLISPIRIAESLRSKTPVQAETGSRAELSFNELKKEVNETYAINNSQLLQKDRNGISIGDDKIWLRQTHEICKIPNKNITKFTSYDDGCLVAKFSCNGKFLACGVKCDDLFCVIVYSVISFYEVYRFPCHQSLIYNIKWSKDDALLVSASADNTISIFSLPNPIPQILPHPAFVYTCDINRDNVIASGSYDGIVRIWKHIQSGGKNEFQLFQELDGHKGFVTSLCFNKKNNIYSADSKGLIIEWKFEKDDWKHEREIFILELKNTVINQLLLCPKEKRMVINSRDNTIRIVDLKSECVLQSLYGALNKRMQTFCSVTPCGNFIYAGSENGLVQVWNIKNGKNVATLTPFRENNQFLTVHCVEFHPFDNFVAISHYGQNLPILLYCYDKNSTSDASMFLEIKESESIVDKPFAVVKPKIRMNSVIRKNRRGPDELEQNSDKTLHFSDVLKKMDKLINVTN